MRMRLAWIERRASIAGRVTKAEVAAAFNVEKSSVDYDMKTYRRLNPGFLRYRRSQDGGAYVIASTSKPFLIPEAPWDIVKSKLIAPPSSKQHAPT